MFVVEIRLVTSETSRGFLSFSRFPVRVGRNPSNELHLDLGFVSEWHGVFERTDKGLEYKDLGSTNGTEIGGVRLPTNQNMVLEPKTTLAIGLLRLEVSHNYGGENESEPVKSKVKADLSRDTRFGNPHKFGLPVAIPERTPPPKSATTPTRRHPTEESMTSLLAGERAKLAVQTAPTAPPTPGSGLQARVPTQSAGSLVPIAVPGSASPVPREVLPSPIPPDPLRRAAIFSPIPPPPSTAGDEVVERGPPSLIMPKIVLPATGGVDAKNIAPPTLFGIAAPPAELLAGKIEQKAVEPAARVVPVPEPIPAVPAVAPFNPMVVSPPVSAPQVDRPRSEPNKTSAPPAPVAPPPAEPMFDRKSDALAGGTRIGKLAGFQTSGNEDMERLLRALCQAVIRLRDGYAQQASEMGIRLTRLDNPLFRATSGEEAARLLTTESPNLIRSIGAVTEFFETLGMHNVALMHAFAEGGRAALHHVDPASPNNETSGRLFRRTDRAKLEATHERIMNLTQNDDALMSVLFGPEFAAAYDQVAQKKKS